MREEIKKIIKKNDKLYQFVRCIHHINISEWFELTKGYYADSTNLLPIVINNREYLGKTKELTYVITFGCEDICGAGLGALLKMTLMHFAFSELIKCRPIVVWGKETLYYDKELEQYESNVYNYYFEPTFKRNINLEKESYVLMDKIHPSSMCKGSGYNLTEDDVDFFAGLYRKYIVLNKETKDYIIGEMKKIFDTGDRTLGIHARGTDFNVGMCDHPKVVDFNTLVEKAKELLKSGNYKRIFLATEDADLLDSFISAFGDRLVYYTDVFRTSGTIGPHSTPNDRPLHHYKLGLEVLRDVYTLANCDALVCGLSNVSLAARYVNLALDKKFDKVIVLNNGINEEDSKAAKILRRESKKHIKEYNHDLHQNP